VSSFGWWFLNLGITLIWLAIGLKAENWFIALGAVVYLFIAFVVELPNTSSTEKWDDEDDAWLG
jgi:hypothetical protein